MKTFLIILLFAISNLIPSDLVGQKCIHEFKSVDLAIALFEKTLDEVYPELNSTQLKYHEYLESVSKTNSNRPFFYKARFKEGEIGKIKSMLVKTAYHIPEKDAIHTNFESELFQCLNRNINQPGLRACLDVWKEVPTLELGVLCGGVHQALILNEELTYSVKALISLSLFVNHPKFVN